MEEASILRFLERYGQALSAGAGDVDADVSLWELPAFVVSDQGARAVTEVVEVEQIIAGAAEWYRSQGLMATRPELLHIQVLGRRIVAVDVRWATLDGAGQEQAHESFRYLLRLNDDGELRIRVVVSVTEPE
jgi:hypothetical protein